MAQLTPLGLVKILAHVTAIMLIPMVGGAVAGIAVDGMLGTSPLCVLIGLAVGTMISALGVALYIRSGVRRGYTAGSPTRERE